MTTNTSTTQRNHGSLSSERGASNLGRSGWIGMFCVFGVTLGTFVWAHYTRISRDPGLIGEELASQFRNLHYIESGFHTDQWPPSWAIDVFFWVGSYVLPLTLNSQRLWAVLFSAALSPVLYLTLLTVCPQISRIAALFASFLVALSPMISWYAMVSFGGVFDCTFAFLLFCIVARYTGERSLLRRPVLLLLLSLFLGWCINSYSSAKPICIAAVLLLFFQEWRCRGFRWRSIWQPALIAGSVSGLAVLSSFWPYLYYYQYPSTLFVGGGQVSKTLSGIFENVSTVYGDLFLQPCSYLIGGWLPMPVFALGYGAVTVLGLALIGLWALRRYPLGGYLIFIAVMSCLVAAIAGSAPGVRRGMPALLIIFMLSALGLDALLKLQTLRARGCAILFLWLSSILPLGTELGVCDWVFATFAMALPLVLLYALKSWWPTYYRPLLLAAVALFMSLPIWVFIKSYDYVAKDSYVAWLQRDFTFLPGKNYEQTMETLIEEMRTKQLVFRPREYSEDTLQVMTYLCRRRYTACIPPKVDLRGATFDAPYPG